MFKTPTFFVIVVSKLSKTFASQLNGQVGRIKSYGVVAENTAVAESAAKVKTIFFNIYFLL